MQCNTFAWYPQNPWLMPSTQVQDFLETQLASTSCYLPHYRYAWLSLAQTRGRLHTSEIDTATQVTISEI